MPDRWLNITLTGTEYSREDDAMLRQSLPLLVVAALVCAVPHAEAQSRSRKKDVPRILKAGDEVRLFVPFAVATRGNITTASENPNAPKAGVIGPDFLVMVVLQGPTPGTQPTYQDRLDELAHNELQAAAKSGDKAAVDKMLAEGRAAKVPVDTKLFVTYRIAPGSECRARIVDGADAGKIVEVPVRNVR
jgi:hypothetical protein